MKEYKVINHISSFLPEDKKWKMIWNDEFDGTELDETKWNFREYYWGKKSPTFSHDVILDGKSCLHLPLVKRNGNFYSAHLQTGSLTFDLPKDSDGVWPFGKYKKANFMHKFGYYEIRCKLPKNAGWHAAFWLQAPGIGSHPNPKYGGVECDIMENYRVPTEGLLLCGNGWGGYGENAVWPGHFRVPFVETEDGWHTYAVDWSEDGYIFYADGKEVGRQMAPQYAVSHVEQYLLVSTECHGYHRQFSNECENANDSGNAKVWSGKPVPELLNAVLPDEYIIDYVRVFDQI